MLLKKDKKILFGTKGGFAIARAVFNYPHRSFYLRELAKESKCSTTAITEGIDLLKEYNIINVEEDKVTKRIMADLDSVAYKNYKLIFNLYRITRYGIVDMLAKYFGTPECMSIFGSFARGEDVENS